MTALRPLAAGGAGGAGPAGVTSGATGSGAGDRFELLRALATLCEAPGPSHDAILAAVGLPEGLHGEEHTEVFVLQCHPYASFYLNADGMLGGEAGDRVAGFWRALGLVPPAASDHLAALLGLYAALGDDEPRLDHRPTARAGIAHARAALLWEHLASWVPAFLAAVSDVGTPRVQAWAALLGEALTAETEMAAPPSRLPLALREAPEPPSPGSSVSATLEALLAPARCGVVLTRGRLTAGAREVGVGLRQGERRFTMRAMLDQDPRGTLEWMAREAARWAGLHRRWMPEGAGISDWWSARAATTAVLLETLANRASHP
jgi:hypothetical protein